LLPGLINAHCHLDYTMMRHAIDPPKSFTAWVQRINALKRSLDNDDYLAAIRRGFRELRKWGTTTVCNIEAFPELMVELGPSPLRTWWFYEMIDVRHRHTTEEVVAGALSFFRRREAGLDRYGLSPHAPFTASVSLYQLANACAARSPMALTTHVAESLEEMQMFRDARGPLYDFMKSLQRPMTDCGRHTPFGLLWRSGAINRDWLLAHMNELRDEDFELLGQHTADELPSVVHCPGSHRYFGHSPFPLRRLLDAGVNVCVGTDSLASTESLSLLEELRSLRDSIAGLSGEQLLRMVTVNPARALQQAGQLGQITPGALADLIAVPTSGTVAAIHEEVVDHSAPISWMMIDGKIVP
ncbi:MAG TPA: amidohydrolase family protein, partial [Chthoniobacteraceae bacterium]|nr:amidohydrolase family protein [Chthoniobacteraceae bacterium]